MRLPILLMSRENMADGCRLHWWFGHYLKERIIDGCMDDVQRVP